MSNKPKHKRIVKQVLKNRSNNQLMVTVPSNCGVNEGDHVEIVPLVIRRVNTKNYLVYKENLVSTDGEGNLFLSENKQKKEVKKNE